MGSTLPPSRAQRPAYEPSTGTLEPSAGTQEPGTGRQEPGTRTHVPSTHTNEPSTGTQEPGAGRQEPNGAKPEPRTAASADRRAAHPEAAQPATAHKGVSDPERTNQEEPDSKTGDRRALLEAVADAPVSAAAAVDHAGPRSPDACEPRRRTLSVKETAAIVGVSTSTIYRLVRADRIPFKRVGRRILIARDELEAWLSPNAASDGTDANR